MDVIFIQSGLFDFHHLRDNVLDQGRIYLSYLALVFRSCGC
jgi:hypothetical protein